MTEPDGARLWLFRAGLLLPVLALLLLLEIGARLHAWYSDNDLQRGLGGVGLGPAADDLSLQHIIRWHDNPRIIYELIPGLTGEFRGHRLTISDQGFRGPPVPARKPPGTLRIVGIGDSVMFGWGVGDEDHYLALLGERLAAGLPDRHVDWLNAAVPGYNTVNEVETLKEKLLAFDADVVIVGYVSNDLYVPGFLRKRQPYYALDRSFLAQFVRNALDGLHVPDNELARPPDAFRHRTFLGEEDLIPEAYREVIGLDAFRAAVAELTELSRSQGFAVIVFGHYGFDAPVRSVLEDSGLTLIDGYPVARAWLDARGLNEYQGSPLTVSEQDSHPSALQHALIADQLAAAVLTIPGLVSDERSTKVSRARDPGARRLPE